MYLEMELDGLPEDYLEQEKLFGPQEKKSVAATSKSNAEMYRVDKTTRRCLDTLWKNMKERDRINEVTNTSDTLHIPLVPPSAQGQPRKRALLHRPVGFRMRNDSNGKLVVTKVMAGGIAEDKGVKVGYRILKVNEMIVNDDESVVKNQIGRTNNLMFLFEDPDFYVPQTTEFDQKQQLITDLLCFVDKKVPCMKFPPPCQASCANADQTGETTVNLAQTNFCNAMVVANFGKNPVKLIIPATQHIPPVEDGFFDHLETAVEKTKHLKITGDGGDTLHPSSFPNINMNNFAISRVLSKATHMDTVTLSRVNLKNFEVLDKYIRAFETRSRHKTRATNNKIYIPIIPIKTLNIHDATFISHRNLVKFIASSNKLQTIYIRLAAQEFRVGAIRDIIDSCANVPDVSIIRRNMVAYAIWIIDYKFNESEEIANILTTLISGNKKRIAFNCTIGTNLNLQSLADSVENLDLSECALCNVTPISNIVPDGRIFNTQSVVNMMDVLQSKRVTHLTLNTNTLKDAGFAIVATAIPHTRVRHLFVSNNLIRQGSHFHDLFTHLHSLDLSQNPLSESAYHIMCTELAESNISRLLINEADANPDILGLIHQTITNQNILMHIEMKYSAVPANAELQTALAAFALLPNVHT